MFEVVAHGGAGHFFPHNSRSALLHLPNLNVDRVEIDLQRTRDGHLVLHHDEHLPFGGSRRAIRSLRLTEIQSAAPEVVTFHEGIALIDPEMPLMIDVKSPGYERELIAALPEAIAGRDVIVSSTYAPVLRAVHQAVSGVRTSLSSGHAASVTPVLGIQAMASATLRRVSVRPIIAAARAAGATDLSISHRIVSANLISAACDAGLGLFVWTVNAPEDIDRIARLGPTGIISDRPDRVRAWQTSAR